MIEDLSGRYQEYLARFAKQLGDLPLGSFTKFGGRLIKKMTLEEFTPAYLEYTEICTRYHEIIEHGDTINDLVIRVLREKAANLVLEPPE